MANTRKKKQAAATDQPGEQPGEQPDEQPASPASPAKARPKAAAKGRAAAASGEQSQQQRFAEELKRLKAADPGLSSGDGGISRQFLLQEELVETAAEALDLMLDNNPDAAKVARAQHLVETGAPCWGGWLGTGGSGGGAAWQHQGGQPGGSGLQQAASS